MSRFLSGMTTSFVIAALLSTSTGAVVKPALSLTAPYRGHGFYSVAASHGCHQSQLVNPPRFNKTVGVAAVSQESQVPGASCQGTSHTAQISTIIGFVTRNFSGIGGPVRIVISWQITWTANVSEQGGYKNASALFYADVFNTLLCGGVPLHCMSFQNGGTGGGSAGGSSTPAWLIQANVPHFKKPGNVTNNKTSSALVNVYLNTTLNRSVAYNILVELQAVTEATASSGHRASAELWMHAKLSSISIS